MIVMKFGGTSLEDAASVERVSEIVRARLSLRPVVVVSAMGKTTRGLLQAAEASAAGDTRTTLSIIEDLRSRHVAEIEGLVKKRDGHHGFQLIENYFEELTKLLQGLAILGEVPRRGLDKILSYGELLSSAIVAEAFAERGIPAKLLDSREFIKTDESFGNASPVLDLTNELIVKAVRPVAEAGNVPVIQGFIGSTRAGAGTTLGFEGSDYTATIVGAALGAIDIQIWKDVSGLMTADPNLFGAARTVRKCSYEEAADLTFFGAKVLHPKAVHPAAQRGIPVHIYNSKLPQSCGTEIGAGVVTSTNGIKSIAYKRHVTLVYCRREDPDHRALIEQLGSDAIVTAASASKLVLAVDSAEWEKKINLAGAVASGIETVSGRAIVTVVGNGISGNHDAVFRVVEALRGTGIDLILHGSSRLAIHLVVDAQQVGDVVASLHDAFFGDLDPNVFE
jgi:aspartate kinase